MNSGPYFLLLMLGVGTLISVAIGTVALVFASKLIFKRPATWLTAFLGALAAGLLWVALPFVANSLSSGFFKRLWIALLRHDRGLGDPRADLRGSAQNP